MGSGVPKVVIYVFYSSPLGASEMPNGIMMGALVRTMPFLSI